MMNDVYSAEYVNELRDELEQLKSENARLRAVLDALQGPGDDADEERIEPLDGPARVVVQLTGQDGNIFAILGRCRTALRRAGQHALADQLTEEVQAAKSYDDALQVVMRLVDTR